MPWIGALVGGAVGLVGSAMESSNQPEGATPLTPFQQMPPHMQNLNQEMYNLALTQGMQPYPGFNPNQELAMNMTYGQATGQNPYETGAMNAITAGTQGGMNPMFGMANPYLMSQINSAQGDMQENFNQTTVPMLDSMNTRANTGFGTSSAVDDMRTDAYSDFNQQMANVANDMLYKDYYNQSQLGESNANRMLQAAGMAPMMQNMAYTDINALLGMGNTQQQAPLNYAQQQMNMMAAPFGTLTGGTSMIPGSQSQQPNYLNSALGGAMAGQSIYNSFNQPSNNANMNDLYQSVYGFSTEDMN